MTGEGVYQRKLVGGKKITAVSVCSVDVAEKGAVEREVKGVVAAGNVKPMIGSFGRWDYVRLRTS